jgi:hypothetical protein
MFFLSHSLIININVSLKYRHIHGITNQNHCLWKNFSSNVYGTQIFCWSIIVAATSAAVGIRGVVFKVGIIQVKKKIHVATYYMIII